MTGAGSPAGVPLPHGFRVVLDPTTRVLHGGRLLLGGEPRRLWRLSSAGADVLAELSRAPVISASGARLARRLLDAGFAHPLPPEDTPPLRTVVIIPVRDRAEALDRCLQALGQSHEVLVVDDGSTDAGAVTSVAARHRADLVRRRRTGGPAAARNTGLEVLQRDVAAIAFLDSDCVPPPDWLACLVPHFADPLVAAVAPRVRPSARCGERRTLLDRYTVARSPLDMGLHPAPVRPGGAVAYVPSAALVLRRAALEDCGPSRFDEQLRYGEDVDLVWRLLDAGWRVRYEPSVEVRHEEPRRWRAFVARRYRYGTSAGPLARRHGDRVAPAVLGSWPTVSAAFALVRRPAPAAAATAYGAWRLWRRLRPGVPGPLIAQMSVRSVMDTLLGLSSATARIAFPLALASAFVPGRRRALRGATVAVWISAPALRAWLRDRPAIDPLRWTTIYLLDDLCYGVGVWRGSVSARTTAPLTPRTTRPSTKD